MYIVCVLTWSLLGVKKAWATPRSVSFRGLIQNFRRAFPPLSYAESPLGESASGSDECVKSEAVGIKKQWNLSLTQYVLFAEPTECNKAEYDLKNNPNRGTEHPPRTAYKFFKSYKSQIKVIFFVWYSFEIIHTFILKHANLDPVFLHLPVRPGNSR